VVTVDNCLRVSYFRAASKARVSLLTRGTFRTTGLSTGDRASFGSDLNLDVHLDLSSAVFELTLEVVIIEEASDIDCLVSEDDMSLSEGGCVCDGNVMVMEVSTSDRC
jgi:PIN domain nuclease of toxin-antitoxin system